MEMYSLVGLKDPATRQIFEIKLQSEKPATSALVLKCLYGLLRSRVRSEQIDQVSSGNALTTTTPCAALPPDELFQRILAQINRSKRDILQEKYNACLDRNCPAQTRSVFIRVLKRIAESFMTCLLTMKSGQSGFNATAQPSAG